MAMKLKTLHFLLLLTFLTFMLLASTPEARRFAPNHLGRAIMKAGPSQRQNGGPQLDEVVQVLDLLGMKDSSGPSNGGEGH
ncbi:hypothetical protein QQP08_013833 [Theobroma cacao]|uniref:Uncharacterized protein n=1 Tax=Theobroma cacao TaxID=3641 RepID=A0A061ED50_THECC|nr:Uncharacterized protein TCM_016851 [Theobroma cacao]WRX21346.1 hypothetical protein QQP08_013833 [Theobroma cacao]